MGDVLTDKEAFTTSSTVSGGGGRSIQLLVSQNGQTNLRGAKLDDDNRRCGGLAVESRDVGGGGGLVPSLHTPDLFNGLCKGGHGFNFVVLSGSSEDGDQYFVVDPLSQEFLNVSGLGLLVSDREARQLDGLQAQELVPRVGSSLHTGDLILHGRQLGVGVLALGGESSVNGVHL